MQREGELLDLDVEIKHLKRELEQPISAERRRDVQVVIEYLEARKRIWVGSTARLQT